MNELTRKLNRLLHKKEKIVCAFLTLGYPSLKQTERLILAFEKIGVDTIELGFPFSDPLADGPTIQRASDFALKHDIKMQDAFRLVKKLRQQGSQIPIVFFSYFNPILHKGVSSFASSLKKFGFQGLVVPDLPPEEAGECARVFDKNGLVQIYLVAPTTTRERAQQIVKKSKGFIYYVSLRGVTGARKKLDPDLSKRVLTLKRLTKKPVLVGFGISTVEHVKQVCRIADGIIVGSAIIHSLSQGKSGYQKTIRYVASLVRAAKRKST